MTLVGYVGFLVVALVTSLGLYLGLTKIKLI
uniref:Subunit VI of cytochrome b6/f complex n=1 Tax=Chloropicon maureeniae TaxID=1461542 RepID=A0A4D6C384_9CHLO|nr:subunit VI of cytochrome b6/f complex [Chloropicon maureeniae]QBX98182.1 subunit VI of cytochrome b6/f complex [Chloropicon maureeniae]